VRRTPWLDRVVRSLYVRAVSRVPSASEVLAEFGAGLRWSDIPAPVAAAAKRHLLDIVGVALASSTMPFASMALQAATGLGGAGDGSVIGFADRLPPALAALVNGALAHGIDYDDTHEEGVVHVSCSVAPAALAAAEGNGATGAQFLTALVLGMETAVRLGVAAPGRFHDRGFHPTGVCGAFAATLVAGSLAGLPAPRLADALGLSGSMASGLMEFLTDGTWSKRIHAGWAAHGGLVAARLAAAGFSGPRAVLDGRFGFYRSHLGDEGWQLDAVTGGLGRRWRMQEIALKPYPACHMTHAFIDCAASLRGEPEVTADAIAGIECFIHPREMPIVCEPRASKLVPRTDYDAKFSLPYTVACMLVRGHVDLDDFTPEAIRDPAVLDLARRVASVPDPKADYPHTFPGRLRMTLRNGRVFERDEPLNRGSAERPLSDQEVSAKFRRNAEAALPGEQVDALRAAVQGIDTAPSVRELAARLRSDS
jgi:2-methylcitrate dehydratase PrpD